MKDTINKIYKDNLNYLSRWNTGLANHVPMAAAAMYLMRHKTHCKKEKLLYDAALYTEQLSPKRINSCHVNLSEVPWNVQKQLLGHDDLQESWQEFFNEVFDSDIDAAISTWLSRLGFGLSAAAGHSIIRIHYALALREVLKAEILKQELAVAFADLASRYLNLTPDNLVTGELSLEDFLDNHSSLAETELSIVRAGALIEDRFLLLRTQSAYQDIARNIALTYDLPRCLRRLASMVTESADFTLLHAITVGQSLLDICNWYPKADGSSIRQGYRDYVVMAVLASELPNASSSDNCSTSLKEVYSRVPGLKNDHAQKASYSLARLYSEFGQAEFLTAADYYQTSMG